MANENIEQVIFKLSLDGSAYVEGADKLSASTQKLSATQEAANKKLQELQQTANSYKKSLQEVDTVLKANEKETLELTKNLNALKDAGKGATAEANKLKVALRDIATNTKEFRIEAAQLKTNLATTTTQIATQSKVVKEAAAANTNFTGSLSKAYGGLSRIAQIIPGLGIGGLIGLVAGPLVSAFEDWFESITKTSQSLNTLKLTQTILGEAESSFVKASATVNELRLNVDLAKQGFIDKKKVVEEYNTTMGKTAGTVKTLDEVEQKLVEHGDAYIKMMLFKAAANIALEGAAKKAFEAEQTRLKKDREFLKAEDEALAKSATLISNPYGVITKKQIDANNQSSERIRKEEAKKRKDAAIKSQEDDKDVFLNIAKKFQSDAAQIAKDHNFNFFDNTKVDKPKIASARKEIANIYEQELQKLKADIAKLDEKGFTDESTITKAVEEDFKKRALAFDKAFKNKQLTAPQLKSLKENLDNLQKLTLEQNLKSFREQKDAYLKQISDELENLQFEEATKRISTIQDRFERERQLINVETDKTIEAISQKRDKLISDISKNAAKNGLTPADIAPQIQKIKDLYGKLLDDLGIIREQKLQQLSFDTFEKLSEDAKRLLDSGNLGASQGSLINIQEQAKLFAAGKISFKQYQKEISAIEKAELNQRFQLQKSFLELEIKIRKDKLANDKALTDEQIKRLKDEIRRLEQELVDAEKGNIKGNTPDPGGNKSKIDKLIEYTNAIGDLIQNVIGFWAAANEAEQKALDRSIALQEKRVDAAQRIAARGNAEYLKAEEDRLTELQVKRENAARKQLGINAALQGSEIIVALISGLAQGAKIGGPLGAIAGLAAIAAAIAGAFAIAESLKPEPPSFFVGTKDTGPGGNKDSKGGFSATIHPHEAITPADKNKAYHPVIEAIHDGTIPADHLNNFVKTYHKIKPVPQPNYARIKEAAELSIGQDGRMHVILNERNKKLDELIDLQRVTIRHLKNMGVNVSLDKNGFAVTQMEVIEQMKRDKKI